MSASKGSTVLLVGSGGRENALAWKLARSPEVSHLIIAPGNDGFSPEWERWPCSLADGKPAFESLAKKAKGERVDLVVIGPDNPLADGIVDVFENHGILTFGPKAAAAQIEASKAFSKDVMSAAGVPTARYFTATSLSDAERFLKAAPWPPQAGSGWVVKADGLALGKGVIVCSTLDEALSASRELIRISGKLVLEERLQGEEISWFAICDGERCALMEPARDYKRVSDGNQGPNTGGMGAFSPVPGIPDDWYSRVQNQVFLPTLSELKKRGAPFRGLLYAGLMIDLEKDKFWVIEFNARFGDPETQVLMPRMSDDLYLWCQAAARGDLRILPDRVGFSSKHAVYVVGAAKGYPEKPEKGQPIRGFEAASRILTPEQVEFFAAGVQRGSQGLSTAGGRVLGSLGVAETLEKAREVAYQRIRKVSFEGMHYRTDIALCQ